MKALKHLLGGVVLSCVTLVSSTSVAAPAYSSLVIFGDSLSDSGNNALALGTAPDQKITGNDYIPNLPYSLAPPNGFGTYSNGPVWATQFASMMGLGAMPSLIPGGTNYAFGGARTSGGQVPDLLTQTAMYFGSAPTNVASTLFVVAGGGNNARDTFSSLVFQKDFGVIGSVASAAAATYANDVGNIVDRLQLAGATNIVVWNTPNIGLAPAIGAIPGTFSGISAAHLGSLVSGVNNGALDTRLAGEAGVQIFDLYSLVAQAGTKGFANTTDACGSITLPLIASCSDISKALFWDGIHPTTAGHNLIAQQMFALSAPVPEPSTYAMLFVGLLVITNVVRRRAN